MENLGAILNMLSSGQQPSLPKLDSKSTETDFGSLLGSLIHPRQLEPVYTKMSSGTSTDSEDAVSEDLISSKLLDINEILENLIMQIKADAPQAVGAINFGDGDINAELETAFAGLETVFEELSASGVSDTQKMDAMIKYINNLVSPAAPEGEEQLPETVFKDLITGTDGESQDDAEADTTVPVDADAVLSADVNTVQDAEIVTDAKLTVEKPIATEPKPSSAVQSAPVEAPKPQTETAAQPEPKLQTDVKSSEPVRTAEQPVKNTEQNQQIPRDAKPVENIPVEKTAQQAQPVKPETAEKPTEKSAENRQPAKPLNVEVVENKQTKQAPEQQPEKVAAAPVEKNSQMKAPENVTENRESLRAESAAKSTNTGSGSGEKGNSDNSGAFAKTFSDTTGEQAKAATPESDMKGTAFDTAMKQTAESAKPTENMETVQRQKHIDLTDSKDVARLINKLESIVTKGESKLTVTLTPENLGRLEIRLIESGGRLSAKLLADNESAHKLIVSGAEAIKSQLAEKGIVIDNMEFSFSDTAKQESNENKRASAKNSGKKMARDNDGDETADFGKEIASNKDKGLYA